MKTRDSASQVTRLPPAPAPTSRDANRWPLSGGALDGARSDAKRGRIASQASDPVAGSGGKPRRRSLLQGAAVPLLAALVMGVFTLLRSRGGGSFEEYRGLLIALAVIAFLLVSRIGSRSSSRGSHRGGG